MSHALLILFATLCYAGYNIFIKVSGDHVPNEASSTILATVAVQCAALFASICFLGYQLVNGVPVNGLSHKTYLWAVLAGISIGIAEIIYIYLFSGLTGPHQPVQAGTVIMLVVGGTILITALVSVAIFGDPLGRVQISGVLFMLLGLVLMFFGR